MRTTKSFVKFSSSIAAALALLASCTTASDRMPSFPVPSTASWTQYQLSSSHNAVLTSSIPAVIWSTDTQAKINGGLAVAGDSIFADTFAGDVLALSARNGSVRWKTHLENVVMSTPIVANGLVIVGTGDNGGMGGNSGFVYAPNASSGHDLFWGRDVGDHIVALDAATGAVRWKYKTQGEDMPSPIVIGDTVIFANGDADAYGLSLATGEAKWRTPLGGIATMASATEANGNAIVSVCTDFEKRFATIALDPANGKIAWRSPLGNCDSSPSVSGNSIFVSGVDAAVARFGYGARTIVGAIDARTGATLWTWQSRNPGAFTSVGSSERAIAGTVADDTLFQSIITDDAFGAFDAASGKVRWMLPTMSPVKMSPIVAHGFVYFGDTTGLFYQVNEKSGKVVAVRIFKSAFTTSPPILMGDTMLIVNGSSVVTFPRTQMK